MLGCIRKPCWASCCSAARWPKVFWPPGPIIIGPPTACAIGVGGGEGICGGSSCWPPPPSAPSVFPAASMLFSAGEPAWKPARACWGCPVLDVPGVEETPPAPVPAPPEGFPVWDPAIGPPVVFRVEPGMAPPGAATGMPSMPGTTLNSPSQLQMALMTGAMNPYDLYANNAATYGGGFGSA